MLATSRRRAAHLALRTARALLDSPRTVCNAVVAAAGARLNTRSSFEPTRLVWSRGLALTCDVHGGLDFVRKQRGGGRPAVRFDPREYADIREGDLVWVRSTALPQFVREVLPHINARFALVTGDEDWPIPFGFDGSHAILANANMLCWFAQNADGTDTSGKIFPLPIGVDFHTISNRRKWGHLQATPRQQERELERIRASMPDNADRLVRAHADFHFNKRATCAFGDTRDTVQKLLSDCPVVDFQRTKVARTQLWREKTRYAFVVSPHGNGLDCHRTWESLLLGNIPIVKRSPIDSLYDGLPVVIVDDWREITAASLHRWHECHRACFGSAAMEERLTNEHWIFRIRRTLAERMAGEALRPE